MTPQIKIKRIKCQTCSQSFKVKTSNFERLVEDCHITHCGLATQQSQMLIYHATHSFKPIVVPATDTMEIVIDDAIAIRIDKNGRETRTLS